MVLLQTYELFVLISKFMNSEFTVIDHRCNPGCKGKTHYIADGSCPEECGEGGYCCSVTHDNNNKCSLSLIAPYTSAAYTLTGRPGHYCLRKVIEQFRVNVQLCTDKTTAVGFMDYSGGEQALRI